MDRWKQLASTLVSVLLLLPTDAVAQYFGPTPKTRSELSRPQPPKVDSALYALIGEAFAVGAMTDSSEAARARERMSADLIGLAEKTRVAALAEADSLPTWSFPITEGREGIKRLYLDSASVAGIQVIGRFAANIRDDQLYVTTDLVDGAIGPVPFGVTTAAVLTKADSVDGQPVEGISSNVTRLVYNGGTLALRLTAPFAMISLPDVAGLASVNLRGGLLGDLSKPDSMSASFTPSLDLNFRFRILSLTSDSTVGSVIVPLRVGWAVSGDDFGMDPFGFDNFMFFQAGFGLQEPGGKFNVTALFTAPFRDEVGDLLPRIVLSLSATR